MAKQADSVTPAPSAVQLPLPNCKELSAEQLAAVAEFIKQVGGIDRARQAIGALHKLKEAA
jgi:hypothetical protein